MNEVKMVTIDLKETDVHLKCGDVFIEWDDDSFTRHMNWVCNEKSAQDSLLILREQTVDLIMEKAEKHNENKKLKQQLKTNNDTHEATLNVLRDTLARLKSEGNVKVLVNDIEQYFIDIGVKVDE